MNTTQMYQEFEKLTARMKEIMRAKNNDYSAGSDPFRNFRRHGDYGIVVRMGDKMSRLESFIDPRIMATQAVYDESVEDTALDLANYALILILLRRAERELP